MYEKGRRSQVNFEWLFVCKFSFKTCRLQWEFSLELLSVSLSASLMVVAQALEMSCVKVHLLKCIYQSEQGWQVRVLLVFWTSVRSMSWCTFQGNAVWDFSGFSACVLVSSAAIGAVRGRKFVCDRSSDTAQTCLVVWACSEKWLPRAGAGIILSIKRFNGKADVRVWTQAMHTEIGYCDYFSPTSVRYWLPDLLHFVFHCWDGGWERWGEVFVEPVALGAGKDLSQSTPCT